MGEASGESRRSNSGEAPSRLPRCLPIVVLVLAAAALLPGSVFAEVPAGPRLAVSVFRVYPNAGTEVLSVGPAGEAPLRLAGGPDGSVPGPQTESRPAWSPDGSLLAFAGSGDGTSGLYVARADGSRLGLLPGSGATVRGGKEVFFQGDPVFTADGRALAVTAIQRVRGQFERPARRDPSEQELDVRFAIWAIPVDGSPSRPLTPWQRRAILQPGSFSPSGRTLVASAYDGRSTDVVALPVGVGAAEKPGLRGGMRVLARSASEPVLSPDGSRLAFVRHRFRSREEARVSRSALLTMPAAGGAPEVLARARGGLRWPNWDPSGQRLSFTRLSGFGPVFGLEPRQGNAVMQVNVDGSCLIRVLSTKRDLLFGAAWQPGPGREAGPIVC